MQNKYNINIWFYRSSTEYDVRASGLGSPTWSGPHNTKVEILERFSNFVKCRKNVRLLAWDKHGGTWSKTNCALIENIDVLLERPNNKRVKYWFCNSSTYWFTTQQKFETHECCTKTKPKIVYPKLKQINFKNHYKQQEVKNIIYSKIECYMDSINKEIADHSYKISDHIPIAVGFSINGNYKSYFSPDFIKIMSKIYLK